MRRSDPSLLVPNTTNVNVNRSVNVDVDVAQSVAATLAVGQPVKVVGASDDAPITARITAVDARVDPNTHNTPIRARLDDARPAPAPGASVRIQVPVGPQRMAVVVPASALRKGPDGDQVFVLAPDKDGKTRAHGRKVTPGPALGDDIVILSGIAAGERVAASGSFKLRESALVAVTGDSARTPNVLSSR